MISCKNIKKTAEKKKVSGFTLIEIIIYGALVTMIIGALVLTSVNILGARARITAMEEVSHNARFALERIMSEIRGSQAIETVSGSQLKITNIDGDPVEFNLTEGVIKMSRGEGATRFSLTGSSVNVSSLQFSDVSYEDTSGAIRIEMTVEFANPLGRPEWDFQRTFYATENLRK